MTNDQIQLVKNSWGQVTPIANEAGELFYKNLFEAAPEVRSLFKTDVKDQSKTYRYALNGRFQVR